MRATPPVPSLLALSLVLLSACEIVPPVVTRVDIDNAFARKSWKTMCKGVEMKEDEVRQYATSRLAAVVLEKDADPEGIEAGRACVCANMLNERGQIDIAVAKGLEDSERDDMVGCLAEVIASPGQENRKDAIKALADTKAPVAKKALAALAADTSIEPEGRISAVRAIGKSKDYKAELLGVATTPGDASVRAAAVTALARFTGDAEVIAAVGGLADADADGLVRGTALATLKGLGAEGVDGRLCAAMMQDPDPQVRRAAVLSFQGTKKPELVQCVRERALTREDDSEVRGAILTVLKSSSHDDAALALCDAIPSWVDWYSDDDMPSVVPNADIAKAQNDRDYERSLACMQKAYGKRGSYSCYGQRYIGWWYEMVGGTAHIPFCPPKYPQTE